MAAHKGITPVYDNIMKQSLLANNIFAFYITNKKAEEQGFKSDLTFGYYDKEKFKGELHWNPVIWQHMFGLKLDDLLINGISTGVCDNLRAQGKECMIAMDSGTALMSVPTSIEK